MEWALGIPGHPCDTLIDRFHYTLRGGTFYNLFPYIGEKVKDYFILICCIFLYIKRQKLSWVLNEYGLFHKNLVRIVNLEAFVYVKTSWSRGGHDCVVYDVWLGWGPGGDWGKNQCPGPVLDVRIMPSLPKSYYLQSKRKEHLNITHQV